MKKYLRAAGSCVIGAGLAWVVAAFALMPLFIASKIVGPVPDVLVGIMLGLVFGAFFETSTTYAKNRVEEEEKKEQEVPVPEGLPDPARWSRRELIREWARWRDLALEMSERHDGLVNELRVAKSRVEGEDQSKKDDK